ncbi:hypothetical protein DUI87_07617 [Hirundo rustica rustica]|uniref:Uncharacterized protein n=1 Tax=Hirundo rustica rustica TaxID=333673 RepID=A0A3M0KQR2_HIRRU|nr:hypothetical protein DUI87_07617 [Hirundo rustica rustica]
MFSLLEEGGGRDASGSRAEILLQPGEDPGEEDSPSAAHGDPQWSKYPPAAPEGADTGEGGCPKEAVTLWEACGRAGSWKNLWPCEEPTLELLPAEKVSSFDRVALVASQGQPTTVLLVVHEEFETRIVIRRESVLSLAEYVLKALMKPDGFTQVNEAKLTVHAKNLVIMNFLLWSDFPEDFTSLEMHQDSKDENQNFA